MVGVARLFEHASEPWWIITGAAVALHGVVDKVADVDVVAGADDAARVLGHRRRGIPGGRYRSAIFGRVDGLPLPVEIMAGLELRSGGRWHRVSFATREPVTVDGATLFVPSRAELAALLSAIGRPKDRRRAAALAC